MKNSKILQLKKIILLFVPLKSFFFFKKIQAMTEFFSPPAAINHEDLLSSTPKAFPIWLPEHTSLCEEETKAFFSSIPWKRTCQGCKGIESIGRLIASAQERKAHISVEYSVSTWKKSKKENMWEQDWKRNFTVKVNNCFLPHTTFLSCSTS